jgi:hypothetical protein
MLNRRFYTTTCVAALMASSVAAVGALGLLSGESDGFAIDSTTYPPTVAVKDTGTPANDLNNVDFGISNIVQSGTSPKMVFFPSSPYVRWTPHNLFLNSASPATQNVTLVTGFVYTVTVTGAGGGNITGSSGASGTATTGSPATFTATGTTGTFTLTGSLDTIQINRGSVATPYLATTGAIRIGVPQGYDNATSQYGVWVEPAATNVVLRSQELSNASWTTTGNTLTAAAATAPDGTTTGWNYASTSSFPFQALTTPTDTTYSFSLFVKYVDVQWLILSYSHVGGATDRVRVWFDIQNGVVGQHLTAGSGTYVSKSMTAVGNGWYYITMAGQSTAANMAFAYRNATADGTNTTQAGNTYVWGPQAEVGTVATSYIPTVSATVTRAADSIASTTSSFPAAGAAHSLRLKARLIGGTLGTAAISLATSGDATEVSSITHDTGPIAGVFSGDSGTQASFSIGSIVLGTTFNAAARFTTNDFHAAVGGTLSGSPDTSGNFPAVHDRFDIATGAMNWWLYEAVSVPRAYDNSTLQAKTA